MAGWEQELLAFLGRSDMKSAMHKHVVAARKNGVRFGTGGGVATDEDEAKSLIEKRVIPRLESAIIARIPSMKKSKMFKPVAAPAVTSDGAYAFTICFEPSALTRDSLYGIYGDPVGDGLDNVVAYLSHGAKPLKHYIAGYWTSRAGKRLPNGKANVPRVFLPKGYERMSDPFLVNAVAAINAELKQDGVTVILEDEYLPK